MTLVKLELVCAVGEEEIATSSHITFLGRNYFTDVLFNPQLEQAEIEFKQSKFRIHVNLTMEFQPAIKAAPDTCHRERALEKITPRDKKLALQTVLAYSR